MTDRLRTTLAMVTDALDVWVAGSHSVKDGRCPHRDDVCTSHRVIAEARAALADVAHPDAGDETRNHYDWFFPKDAPAGLPEPWLADTEAKMLEAVDDPFVDDAARVMLALIAEVRRLRAPALVQPKSQALH